MNPQGVFACNELDLSEVKVYGFDYDYTLAHYKPSLEHLLYNLGRDMLLEKYKVTEINSLHVKISSDLKKQALYLTNQIIHLISLHHYAIVEFIFKTSIKI